MDPGKPARTRPTSWSRATPGIGIFAQEGSPVVAVNDGEIRKIGQSDRLGNFVVLEDAYGNRYTYSHLGSVSDFYPSRDRATARRRSAAEGARRRPGADGAGIRGQPARRLKLERRRGSRPPRTIRRRHRSRSRSAFRSSGRPGANESGGLEQTPTRAPASPASTRPSTPTSHGRSTSTRPRSACAASARARG